MVIDRVHNSRARAPHVFYRMRFLVAVLNLCYILAMLRVAGENILFLFMAGRLPWCAWNTLCPYSSRPLHAPDVRAFRCWGRSRAHEKNIKSHFISLLLYHVFFLPYGFCLLPLMSCCLLLILWCQSNWCCALNGVGTLNCRAAAAGVILFIL